MRRPTRHQLQRFSDLAIPPLVSVWLVLNVLGADPDDRGPWFHLLGVALAVVQGVALHWRRDYPERVMVITLLGGVVVYFVAPETLFPYAALFALFALAGTRSPTRSVPALLAVLAVSALNFRTATDDDAGFSLMVAVVVWALAEAARNRRTAIDEASRRAVTDEQTRIARELHDVIAHSVSVIVVQAAAADDVFEQRPDQARAALRSIEAAGRDALGELRRLLAPVRDRDGDGAAPTEPLPGLDRLDDLAAPLRAAGLEVEIRREGTPGPLPAGVDLSAYRIVQEALTNTLRHARARRAEVVVRYASGAVELTVTDDGRGATGSVGNGGGHGLVGMRERAALLRGTLEAGEGDAGAGFRVHARLPLEDAR